MPALASIIDNPVAQPKIAGMGLDGVELVMTFEEDFGIAIPDAAAGGMVTPRHVTDFLFQKRGVGSGPCLSQRAFHRLRRALMRLGHERRTLRRETSLATLFPSRSRAGRWALLGHELGCSPWLPLERPPLLGRWMALAGGAVLLLGTWHWGWLAGLAAACAFGGFAWWATLPLRTHLPLRIQPLTLEGLVNCCDISPSRKRDLPGSKSLIK
jgi:hypothetical protein